MQTGKGILIPSILKVGNGTLKKIGQYLKAENLEQVVIFFGNGLIDLFGMDVMNSLKQEGITVLEYSELDTVDIDDIKIGMAKTDGKYVEIPDRKEAIAYAIHHGEPGDIIVLAGKGHEDYQEIKGKKYPMDERVLIREILEEDQKA